MSRGDDERRLDIIDACTSLADVVAARGYRERGHTPAGR